MGGYEAISFINHFKFMKINFLYLNCFIAFYKCYHNKHHILKTLMYVVIVEPILNLCTLTTFHLDGEEPI